MRLYKFSKMYGNNDGTRTLFQSIVVPEFITALKDWGQAQLDCVLIGDLALSYYVKPRTTQNINFLFLNDANIPESVSGFKRTRPYVFQHNTSLVEVELSTRELVSVPVEIVQKIIDTAIVSDHIRVTSPSGLVAAKLFRLSLQDQADIVALIKTGKIDLTDFSLQENKINRFAKLVKIAETDPHP